MNDNPGFVKRKTGCWKRRIARKDVSASLKTAIEPFGRTMNLFCVKSWVVNFVAWFCCDLVFAFALFWHSCLISSNLEAILTSDTKHKDTRTETFAIFVQFFVWSGTRDLLSTSCFRGKFSLGKSCSRVFWNFTHSTWCRCLHQHLKCLVTPVLLVHPPQKFFPLKPNKKCIVTWSSSQSVQHKLFRESCARHKLWGDQHPLLSFQSSANQSSTTGSLSLFLFSEAISTNHVCDHLLRNSFVSCLSQIPVWPDVIFHERPPFTLLLSFSHCEFHFDVCVCKPHSRSKVQKVSGAEQLPQMHKVLHSFSWSVAWSGGHVFVLLLFPEELWNMENFRCSNPERLSSTL